MIKRFAQLVLTAFVSLTAVASHAVVVDFEEFAQPRELWSAGETVSSKGFTFTYAPAAGEPNPTYLFFVGKSWQYNEGGTIALLANSCSAIRPMTTAHSL